MTQHYNVQRTNAKKEYGERFALSIISCGWWYKNYAHQEWKDVSKKPCDFDS
jgi:hypothetical protein